MTTEVLSELADTCEPPHRLYRFFGEGGVLLYIGITDDLGTRWKSHMRKKSWWPDVRSSTVTPYPTRADLEAAEIVAIRVERPLHNVVHNRHAADTAPDPSPLLAGLGSILGGELRTWSFNPDPGDRPATKPTAVSAELLADAGQWWARRITIERDVAAHVQLNRDMYIDKWHGRGELSPEIRDAAHACTLAGLDRIWADGHWHGGTYDTSQDYRWINLYVPLPLVNEAVFAAHAADIDGDPLPLRSLTAKLRASVADEYSSLLTRVERINQFGLIP